jgi:hypothetical protein
LWQDALKHSLETSVIPAFEMSCKAMFEQVDTTFQKGMIEHSTAAKQHFESAHSPLAHALRVRINVSHHTSLESLSQMIVHMHHELRPNGSLVDNYIRLCRIAISKICLFAHGNTSLLDALESFELAIFLHNISSVAFHI